MKVIKVASRLAGALAIGFSSLALSAVTIEPITWNVIGLDSNKPADPQLAPGVFPPDRFPVGVQVCNTGASAETGLKTRFVWEETPATNYIQLWNSTGVGSDASFAELSVGDLAGSACQDLYYFVRIDKVSAAYDFTRDFRVELVDASAAVVATTPSPRELYVEKLVSQNRNQIIGYSINGVAVAPGGSIEITPGTNIQLTINSQTATQGYEQLEVFTTLPPDLFTINSVTSTYSADAGTDPDAGEQVYADGCGWENDPTSPNYHNNGACSGTGKYGGTITTVFDLSVASSFAADVVGQTLIYDFSGSSYHYNSDYDSGGFTLKAAAPGTSTLALVKTGTLNDNDGTPGLSAGDTISYSFTVTNTGTTTLSDLTLADTGATVSGGPIATLAPGASDSTTFTASYVLTAADISAGSYTNTATVTGDSPTGTDDVTASDDDTVPLSATSSVSLVKTGTLNDDDGTPGVSAGDTISYSFTVTNTGTTTLSDLTLADTGATVSGGPIATLAPGASDSTTFTASYVLTAADISAGSYTNTATVTGDSPTGTDDVTADGMDTQALVPTVSLSGRVFQETAKTYDGLLTTESLTNGPNLYVCLNSTPAQYAQVGLSSEGVFTFLNVIPGATYELTLTNISSGSSCPSTSELAVNWFSTGESVDGVTTDSEVVGGETLSDGKVTVTVPPAGSSEITFGIVHADVFDPPFGLKTGEFLDGKPVIRWTMVWINDSPIPVYDAVITDPPPAGTTYVSGSISCVPAGITTVDSCAFDAVAGNVSVQADFGPEQGNPIDEVSAANELKIIFDVTYDAANPEPEYENQGVLEWDPGTGPKLATTDDPNTPQGNDPAVVKPQQPIVVKPAVPVPVTPWQLLALMALMLSWMGYMARRARG